MDKKNSSNQEYAQMIKNLTPMSPQASMMARFGNYPMDYSTGVPQISIPLFTIRIGDFELPISIDYHASGIRVQDVATPIGIGWRLNAGGCISKTIMAAEDNTTTIIKTPTEIEAWAKTAGYYNISHLSDSPAEDYQTDRYNYSFCGRSGIFRANIYDSTFHTFPYTLLNISQEPLKYHKKSGGHKEGSYGPFSIKDEKGNIFYFEYPVFCHGDMTYGCRAQNIGGYITEYYLTKIVLNNLKDSILFQYTEGKAYRKHSQVDYMHQGVSMRMASRTVGDISYPIWEETSEDYISNGCSTHSIEYSVTLLDEISWKGNKIKFSYKNDRKENFYYIQGAKSGLERLTKITITNSNGHLIRNIIFDNDKYLGNNIRNYRMLLAGICITGSSDNSPEKYSFSYNMMDLPNYTHLHADESDTNCHEDYWGYANGTNGTYWFPESSIFPKMKSGKVTGTNRLPREHNAKAGILESITYPTGGKTVYEMESNRLDDGTIWGALRCRQIRNYDADSKLLATRIFSYSKAEPTITGDDIDKLYQYEQPFWYFHFASEEENRIKALGDLRPGYISAPSPVHIWDTHKVVIGNPIIPLCSDYGSPIYYYKVKEKYSTDDRTVWKEYDYEDGRTSDMDNRSYSDLSEFAYIPIYCFSQYRNFDFGNQKVLLASEKKYDESNKLVYQTDYHYEEEFIDTIPLGVSVMSHTVLINYDGEDNYPGLQTFYQNIPDETQEEKYRLNYLNSRYHITKVVGVPSFKRLKSIEIFNLQDGYVTQTDYTYDELRRTLDPISKVSRQGALSYNSHGVFYGNPTSDKLTTFYYYPFNYNDAVSRELTRRNIIAPIKTTFYTNNFLTHQDSTAYQLWNKAYLPTNYYHSTGNNPLEKRVSLMYDNNNHLCQIDKDGGSTVSFLWGEDSLYPYAKIEGLTFEDIRKEYVNYLTMQHNHAKLRMPTIDAELLRKILKGTGLMTTYFYEPLVGLKTMIGPNGLTSSFTYDTMGRLKEVYNNGKLTDLYEFNYAK